MLKKSITILSISAAFFVNAQDVSIIKNTVDIYSGSQLDGSAKFNSMAGSMGALGGDVSAITVNPAGLGVFITSNINGTLSINKTKTTSSFTNASNSYELSNTNLGQIGAVAVFEVGKASPWKFVNIGVNYTNKNIEEYIETPGNSGYSFQDSNLEDSSGNTVTGTFTSQGHAYNRTGHLTNMNIALGGNYDNKFYVGGSLNFKSASIEQYDSALLGLDLDKTSYYFDKQSTPYSEDSNGFSLSAGVIGKLNNNVRLGLSLESPTWWSLARAYNEVLKDNLGYYGGTYTEDRTLTTPMKATLSGAFVANKNFAINVDYTLGVTKPKYKVQGPAETQLNSFFSSDYKNLSELRVGAEYRYNNFRLRGGYGIANSPFDSKAGFSDLYIGKRETLGLGVGFDFKSFYVDAAYNRVKINSTNVYGSGEYYNLANNGDVNFFVTNPTNFTSKLEDVRNNINLTVGFKF
jgi:hypothetical protein